MITYKSIFVNKLDKFIFICYNKLRLKIGKDNFLLLELALLKIERRSQNKKIPPTPPAEAVFVIRKKAPTSRSSFENAQRRVLNIA